MGAKRSHGERIGKQTLKTAGATEPRVWGSERTAKNFGKSAGVEPARKHRCFKNCADLRTTINP
jgi:hypothetical protein